MSVFAGIDVGSSRTKVVVRDAAKKITGHLSTATVGYFPISILKVPLPAWPRLTRGYASQDPMKKRKNISREWSIFFHRRHHLSRRQNLPQQFQLPLRHASETGGRNEVPSLIINGDLDDLRCISDEQTKTNVEAFAEQIEEQRSSRREMRKEV